MRDVQFSFKNSHSIDSDGLVKPGISVLVGIFGIIQRRFGDRLAIDAFKILYQFVVRTKPMPTTIIKPMTTPKDWCSIVVLFPNADQYILLAIISGIFKNFFKPWIDTVYAQIHNLFINISGLLPSLVC